MGNAAFEFIVRPYKDTKVYFESRKFIKSFLAMDQNAHISVQEMPPDCCEVQFVVRVQVSIHQPTFFCTSGKNHFHEMNGDVGMAGWK